MAVKPIKTASDRAPSAIEHLFHQCNKDPIVGRPSPASYHKWPLARKLPMATRHTRHYHPELPEPDVFRIRRTWNTACDGHTNIGETTTYIHTYIHTYIEAIYRCVVVLYLSGLLHSHEERSDGCELRTEMMRSVPPMPPMKHDRTLRCRTRSCT